LQIDNTGKAESDRQDKKEPGEKGQAKEEAS
jgi:hypothetical protein